MAIRLVGGGACPEQYEAYHNGVEVAYLRLRHGQFRVEAPFGSNNIIYSAHPNGDGAFDLNERDYYLRFAVDAIEKHLRGELESENQKPPAPDVEYTIEDG